MTPPPAIELRGLTKDYGAGHGVFDLDLEIRRGEIFGFLGPNGSGKTTSMRMLVGLSRLSRAPYRRVAYPKSELSINHSTGARSSV